MKPTFFASPDEFRRWLARNHANSTELLVGFHKKDSGRQSITWPESVDQALCFGWIDGVRRSLGRESYTIRFTPRRRRSIWSAVNIRRAKELLRLGLMETAGRRAFESRDEKRSRLYSFERGNVSLRAGHLKKFRSNPGAWKYYRSRPPGYRRITAWWVVSAKKEETRLKRLDVLIKESEAGRIIPPLRYGKTYT